jgi:uncharacterized protein (DUF2147 family)
MKLLPPDSNTERIFAYAEKETIRSVAIVKCAALASVLLAALSLTASAQSIAGSWLTDTRDGVIEIRPCADQMCGYVKSILNDHGQGKQVRDILNENPKLRFRPICGLPILGNLQRISPGTWGNGWVYDPKRGKGFDVEVTLTQPDTLSVRGYKAIWALGQTVIWTRAASDIPQCK